MKIARNEPAAEAAVIRHALRYGRRAAKKAQIFVIPSKARNLSFFSSVEIEERFLASLGMTK
jgi:hypothetical protein